jgi:2-oxoglutarate dehydrogenase E2 component (dihydrolipoamide succinyltransferase)
MTGRYLRITALSAIGMLGLATLGTPAFAGKMVTVPKITPPPKVVAAVKPVPVPVAPAPTVAPAPAPIAAKAPVPAPVAAKAP